MKKLLLSVALLVGAMGANAQLADGSIAPDFTVTDINGNSHNLYSYLDQGYTVVMDLNATWCGPCWNYHTGGALEDLWLNHGPTGATGVSAGTTNDVIVFMIESDGTTNAADLNGTGGNTLGDWTAGVNFIIVDDAAVAGLYNLTYYPTIFTVCPNRIVEETGQIDAASHYAKAGACPIASGVNNPGLIGYTGVTASCASVDIKVNLQNLGSDVLTAATIEVLDGATVEATYNWTGSLATYGIEEVTVGSVTPTAATTYTIVITSADDDASNNTLTQLISPATESLDATVTVQIVTDQYASETTWELRDGANTLLASGGPWTNLSAGGTTPQTPVDVAVGANDCFVFTIFDSYGDGMDAGYGAGSFTVTDQSGTTLVSGGAFADDATGSFKTGNVQSAGIGELSIQDVKVFPNPATDVINVTFNAENSDYLVSLTDLQGRVMASSNVNASGVQTVSFPVADLAVGSYIVTISTGTGMHTEKVVIK
ncbi:MAG: T9SS type A sorting domain-containing protein [Crocinitomicaceae bacterium]|nr:T9SS type A sorting domain-containing protein [Crocinitomicaceae bacterium]